jgi:hypothetical protein
MRDRGLGGEGCFAENEFLRVWAEGGAIHFQDRRNPNHATSLWFDLFRDRGDTYTVDPIEQSPWNSKHDERLATQDTVVERGPILEELQVEMVAELPAELDETRKGVTALLQRLSITTRVRLAAGIGRADLDVTVDNPGIKDYVLRAVVGVTETDGAVRARDNFFMQEHGPLDPVGLSWFERLKDHDYTTNLLAVGSVALYSKGLHAYNAERRGDCTDTALVLQRGVGYISRSDLAARPVPAAAQVEVPMAQCLGRHTVQLGISLDAAGKTANELARMADDFRYGLIVGPQGIDLRGVPQLGGDVVVLGVKEAEDRQGTIYHVMNYGGTEVEVAFDRAVQPCLLDETADPARPRRTRFLALGPHQIAAVRIE